MKELKEGTKAPSFNCLADNGKKIALKDFKGKKVILYFYPRDLTPGCTNEAKDFQEYLTKIKRKGAVVIGASKDPVEKHLKFKEKYDLKFPLLSDEDGSLCKSFGVWQKKKFMGREFMGIVRTTFIIDEKGTISKVFNKVKVKDHVENVLAEL